MRLTRSRDDVVVSGVLGGLGEYFNIDPTLLRIGFVILAFVGVGAVIPLYVLGAIIIPKAPIERESKKRRHNRDREEVSNKDSKRKKDNVNRKEKVNEINEDDWSDF